MSSVPSPTTTALALVPGGKPSVWEDFRLQKLWLATQQREWSSLAVIATSKGLDTLPIAEMLAHIAWAYRGQPSCVFDLRDLGLRLAEYQVREIQAQVDAGVRVLIALRSTTENPTTIPVARQADAAVLCLDLGAATFKTAERTIAEVGRDKILGSIVLRKRRGSKDDGR